MGKCIICGKNRLFQHVNSLGVCKKCEMGERMPEQQEDGKVNEALLKSYVVTDIETSGLDCTSDRIIEISAIKILNGKKVGRYTSLVHSNIELSAKIVQLTGITTNMIRNCNKNLKTVMKEYRRFIGDYPLIGHNIKNFDIKFINKAYRTIFGCSISNECVDTLILARKYINSPNYKLQTLAEKMKIEVNGAHRALADCETTYALYVKIGELEKEKQEEKKMIKDATTPEGNIVCKIEQIFNGADHEWLRYEKKGNYLIGKCFEEIFRIKIRGNKKNYIVFTRGYEDTVLEKVPLRKEKAVVSEHGSTRIYFDNDEGLLSLKQYIIESYNLRKEKIEDHIRLEREIDKEMYDIIPEYKTRYEKMIAKYLKDPDLYNLNVTGTITDELLVALKTE